MQLAHPNQAQIRQIWRTVGIALSKIAKLVKIADQIECQPQHLVVDERQNISSGLKMEGSFGKYRFTRERRLGQASGKLNGPGVKAVAAVAERDYEPGVCDALHPRENPFRVERSGGPLIFPAWRKKPCLPLWDFAVSSSCRMMRPTGTPVLRETSASH
jgi:hypothetical protein